MFTPVALIRPSMVILAASALGLSACERKEAPSPVPAVVPPVSAPPAVAIAHDPTLDHAELLQALDAAASAYAAGTPGGADTSLAGRRFVVRQAFGCAGAVPAEAEGLTEEGLASAARGADGRTLRLTLSPGDWTGSPLIAGGAETWEAAEGFWLTRPWMRSESCPGAASDPLASETGAPSPQTMGLAAVFEADGSRLGRRNGRAYSFVVRGENDQPAAVPPGGYRLVLEGRMAAFSDGRAIRCRAASPDQRPVCIGAVRLDRVAFEDAQGAVLSEWRAA